MNALLRIQWINMKRDRIALMLSYLLPIGFFTIFAFVFGGMGGSSGGGPASIHVLAVDEDGTETASRVTRAFGAQAGVRLQTEHSDPAEPFTRELALSMVRAGDAPAAIIIPEGFGAAFGSFMPGESARVELIYDAANPLAQHMLTGLLQAASFQAAPDILLKSGLDTLEQFGGGPLTDAQRRTMQSLEDVLGSTGLGAADAGSGEEADDTAGGFSGLIEVDSTAAQASENSEEAPNMVAYYAAAIGVMFLLFSMVGAAGSILEQEEFGVLERLLTSQLGMNRLLFGHWLFFAAVGIVQMAVMFAYASIAFGLELLSAPTFVGCAVMSVATSAAAAAFGLMFATLCKTRAQLSGVSTIVILTLSALGGSMMPKFIASFLETTSQFTFNGWALDGFLKVLWYREPGDGVLDILVSIAPQLGVLAATTLVFLIVARLAARRWEQV